MKSHLLRALLTLGFLWWTAAPAGLCAEEHTEAPVPYVVPATVREWLQRGIPVTFLDAREADEFAAGHLPNAINIHFDQVASLADRLPRTEPVVLYCIHSSHRAPAAAKTLQGLGFTNVHVLEGGIVAWQVGGQTIQANALTQAPTILMKTDRCNQLKGPADGPAKPPKS